MESHDYQSCDFTKLIYTRIYSASGWNRTSDSRFKRPLQYHFVTEAWRSQEDLNSCTDFHRPRGFQDRSLKPLEYVSILINSDRNWNWVLPMRIELILSDRKSDELTVIRWEHMVGWDGLEPPYSLYERLVLSLNYMSKICNHHLSG